MGGGLRIAVPPAAGGGFQALHGGGGGQMQAGCRAAAEQRDFDPATFDRCVQENFSKTQQDTILSLVE